MDDRPSRWSALRSLPWGRIAIGSALVLALVVVVPPFRTAAATVTSRVVIFIATPLAPDIEGFDALGKASRVLASDGTEIGQIGAEQRELVPLAQLPPHVPRAVLAAEDARFYDHAGVDPPAVFRSMFNTATGGGVSGGSTITQQLAKLNYTGSQRTLFRKFKEVLYASKLENKYSKDELLERYLNQVYFGHGAYGIGLASVVYFDIPPQELTPAQVAMLAGKIQAPNALDPYRDPARVQARRDHVLNAMERNGWLSGTDLQAARAAALEVAPDPQSRSVAAAPQQGGPRAPHFVSYVEREAAGLRALGDSADTRRKQLFTGGYTIESTLDVPSLEAATAAAERHLGEPDDPTTAIASVQPGDGAIRLLFGGLDPELQFDPASQGKRQPGSSFKPFVYLAMLDDRIDPRSSFDSRSPQTLDCRGTPWPVENYEGRGGGRISVDDAMVDSVNTVFAQVMVRVGPPSVQEVAESAGIPREDVTPPECAMALGGLRRGVSPLDQAAAFATFAAKGTRAEPYAIVRIKDRNGKVVYQHKEETERAFDETKVGVLNRALIRVVEGGTGRAAAIGRPVAGKTGTTENYGNAWFVGYVPQLATAVWVGRPEGDTPMTDVHGMEVTGGSFPARIFGQYMRDTLQGVPVEDIFTASPDDLSLRNPVPAPPPSTVPPETTTTLEPPTTSSSFPEEVVSTLPPLEPVPTTMPPPPTNAPPRTTTTRSTNTTLLPATTVVPVASPQEPSGKGRGGGD